jgi:hypothetical protein
MGNAARAVAAEMALYPPGGKSSRCRATAIAAGLVILLLCLIRVIYFFRAPDALLIGVIPDDAFYYIQLARHRIADGFWSFDGTAPATGFHLLYGYFLFALFKIFPNLTWRAAFFLIGILASVSMALAAYITAHSAGKLFGARSIPLAIAPYLTFMVLSQSSCMMESWLVMFFSALTIAATMENKDPGIKQTIGLVAIGAFGSLARSDYGMLPGFLFLSFAAASPFLGRTYLKRTALLLAGAVIGVAVLLLHNLITTGHLFQASAEIKLFWSSVSGNSFAAPVSLVKRITLDALLIAGAFTLLHLPWSIKYPPSFARSLPALALAAGCVLTIAGYIFFYRYDSAALLRWYCANFVAPIGITLAAAGYFLFNRLALTAGAITVAVYGSTALPSLLVVPWPHQDGMMKAGIFLKTQPSQTIYAAWNAGIISYFSGRDVINIDGLTNDDAVPYIVTNRLYDYLKIRKINTIVDWNVMMTEPLRRREGGYMDSRFDRCVHSTGTIAPDAPEFNQTKLQLFKIDPACG